MNFNPIKQTKGEKLILNCFEFIKFESNTKGKDSKIT